MSYVYFKKLNPKAQSPTYQTVGAVGADLTSVEDVVISPGEFQLVKTGLAVELPRGVEMQIRPRSGIAFKHGVTVLNAPGTIDCDFTGEIGVILINHGTTDFHIREGDRIAQAVLNNVVIGTYLETEQLSPTERASGGFGSTGRR